MSDSHNQNRGYVLGEHSKLTKKIPKKDAGLKTATNKSRTPGFVRRVHEIVYMDRGMAEKLAEQTAIPCRHGKHMSKSCIRTISWKDLKHAKSLQSLLEVYRRDESISKDEWESRVLVEDKKGNCIDLEFKAEVCDLRACCPLKVIFESEGYQKEQADMDEEEVMTEGANPMWDAMVAAKLFNDKVNAMAAPLLQSLYLTSATHCLLPQTFVLDKWLHPVACEDLQSGATLWGGRAEVVSCVHKCTLRPYELRKIVCIQFADKSRIGAISVTSDHAVAARTQNGKSFKAVRAGDLEAGYIMRTFMGLVRVQCIQHTESVTQVVEIELQDPCSTMFACHGRISLMRGQSLLVEVYGQFAMVGNRNIAEILSFKRFYNFREILLKSPELQSCQHHLKSIGFSTDLSELHLGPGKMFVGRDMASKVIWTLTRRVKNGKPMKCSEIVVSPEYKQVVIDVVTRGSHRAGLKPNPEVLHLCKMYNTQNTQNTFLPLESTKDSLSAYRHSI